MKALIRFLKENRGTSSIEMGLICSLIVLAMLYALEGFAEGSLSIWSSVSNQTTEAVGKATN